MNDNEFTGTQSPRRRRHAWANTKEVYEEYGPNGELIKSSSKWIYTDPPEKEKDEDAEILDWPVRRDFWNLTIGAIAVLVLQYLRSTPL